MTNTTSTVSEAVARPVRTVVQGSPVWLLLELIEAYNWYDFTDRQWGVTLAIGTVVVSAVQNAVENHLGKGFLRNVPPRKVNVVDGDGQV